MQGLAREGLEGLNHGRAGRWRNAEATAVDRVTDQREVDVGHVYANLVGTSGFQLDPYMGMGTEALQHTVVADGRLAALGHGHALALPAMAADRRVDLAAGGDHTDHDALIDAADTAVLQLSNQLCLRLDGLGHHHQTGGVLVQAVDDAGTRYVDDIRHMVQQCVEQGAIGVARSRVDHQPGRLVDHQDVVIFIDDIQLDVLGQPLALGFLLGLEGQQRAAIDDIARTQDGAINRQAPLLDPGGKARARVLSEQLGGDLVEALPAQFGRHLCAKLNDLGHARISGRHSLWFRLHACG